MGTACCGWRTGELRRQRSPFSRIVATGYYDGPTDGVIECATCSAVYSFEKLDWDDRQDMRIYALAPVPGRSFAELAPLMREGAQATWRCWVLTQEEDALAAVVREFEASAAPVELVVAAEDLLADLEVWRPVGLRTLTDWFAELELPRNPPER